MCRFKDGKKAEYCVLHAGRDWEPVTEQDDPDYCEDHARLVAYALNGMEAGEVTLTGGKVRTFAQQEQAAKKYRVLAGGTAPLTLAEVQWIVENGEKLGA